MTIMLVLVTPMASGAPAPKDHQLLKTLQILSEKSLSKRMAGFAAMGPDSYRHLRDIAFNASYSPDVRAEAFSSVVTLGKTNSLPEIERAVAHRDWFMRVLALKAYQSVESTKADTVARQLLLHDPALMVRAAALSHLSSEPLTEEVRQVFHMALADKKNFHRGQSLWIRERISEALSQGTGTN